jgi:hypothetical protein
MFPSRALALALTLLCAARAPAGVVVIDFEDLRHVDSGFNIIGPTYSNSGFLFTASHPEPGNPHRFNVPGTPNPSFAGSTALYNGVAQGTIALTRGDGGEFSLLSMKLAALASTDQNGRPIDTGPFDVTFTGHLATGGTVTQTAHVTGFLTLQRFTFGAGFGDVTSVTRAEGIGGLNPGDLEHQFDDVAVQAVPEPGALALLGAGLGCLSVRFRRRGA